MPKRPHYKDIDLEYEGYKLNVRFDWPCWYTQISFNGEPIHNTNRYSVNNLGGAHTAREKCVDDAQDWIELHIASKDTSTQFSNKGLQEWLSNE